MCYAPGLSPAIGDPVPIDLWRFFTLVTHTDGGGALALNPPGGVYRNDTTVEVVATPDTGWSLLKWTGDAVGSNRVVTVPMDRPRTVSAVFGTAISTSVVGNGSIRFNPAMPMFPYGSIVQAIAVPQPGSYFALWGGSVTGNRNPLALTITNATPTVSALFSSLPAGRFALTIIPKGKGSVGVTPLANAFTSGQVVTVTATADPGSRFVIWSGDAAGTQNPLALLMDADKVITANFMVGEYPVLLSAPQALDQSRFRFVVLGEPGIDVTIEVSTNLMDWTILRVLANPAGSVQFTDTHVTNLYRAFYRAVP
jgi:NOL1/NOP2/fmu family ribosome biogenesis protein